MRQFAIFPLVGAGLVNWLVTTIIVESELARPLRDWVCRRRADAIKTWCRPTEHGWSCRDDDRSVWRWLDYLLRCHLCVGVWVGIAEVLYLGPLVGRGPVVLDYVFSALLVKAIGHLVLEVRPQAWPR